MVIVMCPMNHHQMTKWGKEKKTLKYHNIYWQQQQQQQQSWDSFNSHTHTHNTHNSMVGYTHATTRATIGFASRHIFFVVRGRMVVVKKRERKIERLRLKDFSSRELRTQYDNNKDFHWKFFFLLHYL